MKGYPCTGKSVLAWSLARSTFSTLIALDCVRDRIATLETESPTNTNHLDDLSFDAICRTAARQLRFGLHLIIDCPLSSRSHLDRLLQLSNSTKAHLVVVECKPADRFRWRQWVEHRSAVEGESSNSNNRFWYKPSTWEDLEKMLDNCSDYDTGDVSKIIVDTTNSVKVRELSLALQMLASSPEKHSIDYGDFFEKLGKGVLLTEGEAASQERQKREEGRVRFEPLLVPCDDEDGDNICRACLKPISGPAYKRIEKECDLRLHKSCAELPQKAEIRPQDFPKFLQGIPRDLSFPEIIRCRNCETNNRDYRECHDCLFESFVRSALLPSVLHHPCHEHPLQVKITPISNSLRSGFRCQACGDPGEHICYKCYECGFECHVGCGLLPHISKQMRHRHRLTVSFLGDLDDSEEYLCDACETLRNPKYWIYYCVECEFHCHLKCMTFDS